MDLPNAKDNLEQFKKKVKLPVYEISAMSNIGLDEVLVALGDALDKIEDTPCLLYTSRINTVNGILQIIL